MKHPLIYKCTLATTALTAVTAYAGSPEKPNILFAFGDDYGRYAGIYHEKEGGNTLGSAVKTPVFDKLAREGALFLNAFVTAPSSTPCRSSLLSGQYFWRTGRGAILQGAVWDTSIPSYPLILRDNGYHIGKTYKVWSPGTEIDAPYGGQAYGYEKHGKKFGQFSIVVSQSANPDKESAKQELYDEVTGNFRDFLKDRDPDKPFCYWWGPTNTHRAWEKGSGKALWGINPDDLKGKLPAGWPDIPEIREDVADYLGEVQAFDHALGELIEVLRETGELDNTVIVVSGDHGIPGFPKGKCNLYDLGLRVPLLVRYPALVKSGRVVDDFVNLMDLAPTFLELAGLTPPDVMTGKSLVHVLKSPASGQVDPERTFVISGRERHVASAREGELPYPHRSIATKKYKYIRNFRPDRWPMGTYETGFKDLDGGPTKTWYMDNYYNETCKFYMDQAFAKRPYEELYDLEKDPYEVNNLAKDPTYQAVLKQLSDQLETVLIRTGDPRILGKGDTFDKYPFTIPN
ncbi:MAG: sulfatase [Tannerella sp.]|jgi:arylsulfatase A-like enzyme|nr:sulfatase [Tannerella sp.]